MAPSGRMSRSSITARNLPSAIRRRARRTPVYFATAAIYAGLVALGFFGPTAGGQMPDAAHLLVGTALLAVAAIKLVRLGLRKDDVPVDRRDFLEAGFLLSIPAAILVQATGGALSPFVPATYLVVALLAAHTDFVSSVAFAALLAALEVATVAADGRLETDGRLAGTHAALLMAFGLGVGAFLRIERARRQEAQRSLARLKGHTEQLASDTDDVGELRSARALGAKDREKRIRELKNQLDESVHRALVLAKTSLSAHSVLYLKHDTDRERLTVADAVTESDHVVEGDLDPREGFLGAAMKAGKPIALADVRGAAVAWYRKDDGVRSVVIAPMIVGARLRNDGTKEGGYVAGLLVADHVEADKYGTTAGDVLMGLADMIAELEHGGRERERHQKLQDQLKNLIEVSRSLQDTLSPEQLAERALTASRDVADFDFAMVAVAGGAEDHFAIQHATGVDAGRLLGKEAPTGDTLVGWVLRNRVYLNVADARARTVKTPLLGKRLDPEGLRAALVFPMLREGGATENGADRWQVVGAIVFGSVTRDAFTADEFEMLELVARHASLAMSNAVLYRRMEELATTDGLTGLNNHRFYQETATREVERAQRNPSTRFTLVIADIDHFKKVNDTYGHPTGDEVLRRVGRILKSQVARKTDLVARYGGEEFVMILTDTDAAGARAVIDRVRAAVQKEVFEHDGRQFGITMSAGVCSLPDDVAASAHHPAARVKQAMYDRADRALYHTKESGRNRTTLWSEIAAEEELAELTPAPIVPRA